MIQQQIQQIEQLPNQEERIDKYFQIMDQILDKIPDFSITISKENTV